MRHVLRKRLDRLSSSPGALVALVGANAVPVPLVLFWDWTVFEVVLFYWVENGVIGLLNIPKILLASNASSVLNGEGDGIATSVDLVTLGSGFTAAFFLVHYGVFWLVHGTFVFALGAVFGDPGPLDTARGTVFLAAGTMVVSHGVSFWRNYLLGGEYRSVSTREQMFRPYGRVVTLHTTIIFGAFLIASVGSPLPILLLLVALKTGLDARSHIQDHAPRESTAGESTPEESVKGESPTGE